MKHWNIMLILFSVGKLWVTNTEDNKKNKDRTKNTHTVKELQPHLASKIFEGSISQCDSQASVT